MNKVAKISILGLGAAMLLIGSQANAMMESAGNPSGGPRAVHHVHHVHHMHHVRHGYYWHGARYVRPGFYYVGPRYLRHYYYVGPSYGYYYWKPAYRTCGSSCNTCNTCCERPRCCTYRTIYFYRTCGSCCN